MQDTAPINKAKFRSTEEYERAMDLIFKQNNNQISDLEFQPVYLIQEKFLLRSTTYQAITYKPDFRYKENELTIVEDVKASEFSEKSTSYQMRKKMFLFQYGKDVVFRQIVVVNGKETVKEY